MRGGLWHRDLRAQTELAKFLENWCFRDKIQCPKKSANDKIDLRRKYEDFTMHEPENIVNSTDMSIQIRENWVWWVVDFFGHWIFHQVDEVCTDLDSMAWNSRSRAHYTPRWTTQNAVLEDSIFPPREFDVLREHLWSYSTPPLTETVTRCVLWSFETLSVTIGTLCNDFVKIRSVISFSAGIVIEALWARDQVLAHVNHKKLLTAFSELSRVQIMLKKCREK